MLYAYTELICNLFSYAAVISSDFINPWDQSFIPQGFHHSHATLCDSPKPARLSCIRHLITIYYLTNSCVWLLRIFTSVYMCVCNWIHLMGVSVLGALRLLGWICYHWTSLYRAYINIFRPVCWPPFGTSILNELVYEFDILAQSFFCHVYDI